MALGLTQPLIKMSTRDVPGGKGSQCVRLTTYHLIVPMSRNLGALTLLDPSGPAWPVMGVLYLLLNYRNGGQGKKFVLLSKSFGHKTHNT
jgi:hypothetical protein